VFCYDFNKKETVLEGVLDVDLHVLNKNEKEDEKRMERESGREKKGEGGREKVRERNREKEKKK
jgi:hypothetical protein